ncbi:YpdA family putative bacillithiol disulfide reductase [Flavitalea sp.]|nr:YpdA family putative bacillithiol disulfide reductase [Flavitalea sp.]
MENRFDILIIGGGPIGLASALAAKEHGLSYLILEKGALVNSLFNYPANMSFFSTSEKLEIGGIPFVSNNFKPTRPEALEYYRRVATSNELRIHLQEQALSVKQLSGGYSITTSRNKTYQANNVIIATGFFDIPVLMSVPGEGLSKVTHYYKEAHFYAMQKVVVVGASNSAVDAALETYRKGASVTMIVKGPEIGERVKYWVRPDIINRIKEGSIKAYFNSRITRITETTVEAETPDGKIVIDNDYVIAMTGYKPNFAFLKETGIELSGDDIMCPAYNSETMESNLPGLYLAGVVCGGMNTHVWFIENSREHAVKIIKAIVAKKVPAWKEVKFYDC